MAEASHSRTDDTASGRLTAQLTFATGNRVAPGARQAPPRGAASESLTFRAAISLGSSLRRIEHRVIGIELDAGTGPADPHAAVLCLEDGRRIPKVRAITNLRYGVEAYFTERGGVRSRLRVVDPCSRCGEAYLRADEGATQADTLLSLPPCPPGQAPSPSGSEAANLPPPEP